MEHDFGVLWVKYGQSKAKYGHFVCGVGSVFTGVSGAQSALILAKIVMV